MMNRYSRHFDCDIMISGFEVSLELLNECSKAVAKVIKEHSGNNLEPIIIHNAYDDFFGKSINVLA